MSKKSPIRVHPSHFGQERVAGGLFKATCKLKRAVPFNDLDEATRALVDAGSVPAAHGRVRIRSRWDKKLGEVVDLPCDFTTEDRAAFEEHMRTEHGRAAAKRAVWSTPQSELPYVTRGKIAGAGKARPLEAEAWLPDAPLVELEILETLEPPAPVGAL